MKKSDGILSLKKAAKLLNKHAPEGESLAYINPEEARLLKSHGGSGIMTLAGVPSYWSWKDVGKKILEYGPKVMEVVNWFKGPKDPSNQLVDQSTQTNQSYDSTGMETYRPTYAEQYKTPSTPWSDIVTGAKKWATERYSNPANIMRDVATLGTVGYGIYEDFKKGKIDKENFERQMAEEAANRAEIQANLGQFSVGDIPQEEDIAQFTEATGRPDMETNPWAAEGGRIGAFNGGIQGLMPQRIGYNEGTLTQQQITQIKQMNGMGSDISTISSITGATVDQINNVLYPPAESQAQGGRIGASNGGIQGLMPRRGRVMYPGGYNGDTDFQSWAKRNHIDLNALNATDFQNAIDRWNDERPQHLPQKAQGGRIGYQGNGAQDVDPMAEIVALMSKRMTEGLTQDETDRLDKLIQATGFMEQKAQGGRIGYADGTEEWMSEKEKGPLYIDPESVTTRDAPLTSFESDLRFIDKEDRIDMYYDMLKRLHGMSDEEKRDYLHGRPWYRPEGKGTALEFTEDPVFEEFYETGEHFNKGGRIGAQEGGVMPLLNLGGMEKDYREDGGFVPLGRQEKADDVPARLSKNEFVFTADAVRAAGGGDIDEGAQRMYNVMKNLEAGGEISQETQGKI